LHLITLECKRSGSYIGGLKIQGWGTPYDVNVKDIVKKTLDGDINQLNLPIMAYVGRLHLKGVKGYLLRLLGMLKGRDFMKG